MAFEDTTFYDCPVYRPASNAVLVGTVGEIDRFEERLAAYYRHPSGSLIMGRFTHNERELSDGTTVKGELAPALTTEERSSIIGHQARALADEVGVSAEVALSPVGEALYDADRLEGHSVLGVKQAHVYALKVLHGFTRQETATVLNVSPNTVATATGRTPRRPSRTPKSSSAHWERSATGVTASSRHPLHGRRGAFRIRIDRRLECDLDPCRPAARRHLLHSPPPTADHDHRTRPVRPGGTGLA